MGQGFAIPTIAARFLGSIHRWAAMIMRMVVMMRMCRELRGKFIMTDHMRAPCRARDNQRAQQHKKGHGPIHGG